jgi:hypothetical protein
MLNSERLPQTRQKSCGLSLTTSHSAHKTAFCSGTAFRTGAWSREPSIPETFITEPRQTLDWFYWLPIHSPPWRINIVIVCLRAAALVSHLQPGRRNSGQSDPQMYISQEGDPYLRTLFVHILGPFEADSDLRRWGLKLAEGGGRNGKKRALIATARKLAVLLHRLWGSGEVYEPLRNSSPLVATAKAA